MRKLPILLIAIATLFCSCEKLNPGTDPDLGEFASLEYWIDMTQHNKFKESLFVNNWNLESITSETYVDGKLQNTNDASDIFGRWSYDFHADHTITANGQVRGKWMYSHNYLIWKFDGSLNSEEVVKVTSKVLILKGEEFPVGVSFTPYIHDKSGTHKFFIYEYHAQ